jgi:GTP-binding protein
MTDRQNQFCLAFNSARFLTSAQKLDQCPQDHGIEIAFAGRSNAGKSSAINALCNNKGIARTSKTPGRTQLINFFSFSDPDVRLVDLPGYGFAKVSHELKDEWGKHLDAYLRARQCLKVLVLIMDIRKPLTPFDQMMLDWSRESAKDTVVLLTKADKLKFGAAKTALLQVRKQTEGHPSIAAIHLFSSLKKEGIEACRQTLNGLIDNDPIKAHAECPDSSTLAAGREPLAPTADPDRE